MTTWTIAEGKAKFSEMVDLARAEGPQIVTRNGKKAVVVVGYEEWERRNRRSGSLTEFFDGSPLRGAGIERLSVKDKAAP